MFAATLMASVLIVKQVITGTKKLKFLSKATKNPKNQKPITPNQMSHAPWKVSAAMTQPAMTLKITDLNVTKAHAATTNIATTSQMEVGNMFHLTKNSEGKTSIRFPLNELVLITQQ